MSRREDLSLLARSLSLIGKLISKSNQGFNSTQKKVDEALEKINNSEGSTLLTPYESKCIKDVIDLYITNFSHYEKLMVEFDQKLDMFLQFLAPTLVWFCTEGPARMKYINGKSPWTFQLQHLPNRIDEIQKMLLYFFKTSQLKCAKLPKIGDIICVQENMSCFRAAILRFESNDKVSLVDVDKGFRRMVKLNCLYTLPSAILEIPAQTVQCSLLPEDPEGMALWNENLQQHFHALIFDSTLSVELMEELSDFFPPKFLVQVVGYNESITYKANFNKWLCDRLLPEIKIKNRQNEDISLAYLDELNPFEESIDKSNSCNGNISVNGSEHVTRVKQDEKSSREKPLKMDNHVLTKTQHKPYNDQDQRVENSLDSTVTLLFKDVPYAHAAVVFPVMSEKEEMLTISNLADEYQPQDGTRLCYIYQKNKHCWKKNCQKVHEVSSGNWTNDKIETYCNLFNKIDLPNVFQEVPVKVLGVISDHLFYVALHPNYSGRNTTLLNQKPLCNGNDIGEEVSKIETLKDLEHDLNESQNFKRYRYFQIDPALGELVIAKDKMSHFKRGRVIDIYKSMANVFFIDYGIYEEIAISHLYCILPQFLHLPAQAVLTSLSGITTVNVESGREFLEGLILGKILSAKTIVRNLDDSELEVKLYTKDRVCINKLMVDKGYCKCIEIKK